MKLDGAECGRDGDGDGRRAGPDAGQGVTDVRGGEWNEAQTVTVTAAEDDDAVDDEVTLAHTASGGDYGSVTEDLPVTVDDGDTVGLVVDPSGDGR